MISRIWHGYTIPENADAYEYLLYEAAVVPPKARALLSHFDQRSQHYEVREQLKTGAM